MNVLVRAADAGTHPLRLTLDDPIRDIVGVIRRCVLEAMKHLVGDRGGEALLRSRGDSDDDAACVERQGERHPSAEWNRLARHRIRLPDVDVQAQRQVDPDLPGDLVANALGDHQHLILGLQNRTGLRWEIDRRLSLRHATGNSLTLDKTEKGQDAVALLGRQLVPDTEDVAYRHRAVSRPRLETERSAPGTSP